LVWSGLRAAQVLCDKRESFHANKGSSLAKAIRCETERNAPANCLLVAVRFDVLPGSVTGMLAGMFVMTMR
jgi:hypothetical protein